MSDQKSKAQSGISIEGLRFAVGGQVLVEIDALEINASGATVVLGPNGAGKSLFLRLLHGLIDPSEGRILFAGNLPDENTRRGQAMVFQKPILLRRSVAANIDFALKAAGVQRSSRPERVSTLLARAGLSGMARQPARTLSGGEQQRLAIVRALANNPATLFLDEPTSSLDPSASAAVEELIAMACKSGTRIIMVTHDIGLAQRLADDILFMHQGTIAESSSVADFFAKPRSSAARQFLSRNLVDQDND